MPIREVERLPNGKVVQKVIDRKGKIVRYQSGYPGDFGLMQSFNTLAEARYNVGILPNQKD